MGCDIHMFIEYKCGNGMPWQADDHHQPIWEDRCKDKYEEDDEWCDWCKQCGTLQLRCDQGYLDFRQVDATGRSYGLFGLLAGVRSNGPRDAKGLPEDVSDMIKAASVRWGSDGHSHSFITLEEFKNVLFKEAKLQPTDRSDAFYEYSQTQDGWKKYPPDYTTIVNYCEKLKEEKSVDKHILGEDISSEVQVRLVFWFDN